MTNPLHVIPLSLLLATLCVPAAAQCTNPWLAENAATGLNGEVYSVHRWDRDGAGPLPEVWVFAGVFTGAGAVSANRIAAFDPATLTWSALGAGVNGIVHAMATLPNGNLVVAGEFTTAGGIPTSRIAMWNGTTWAALGAGFDLTVYALAVRPSGTLVAGGGFAVPGSTGRAVAEWNGTSWSSLGGFAPPGTVRAFATLANGDLLASGAALVLGGGSQWVIRWNGTSWAPFAPATAVQPVFTSISDLLVRANGDVVMCGAGAGSVANLPGSRVAVWNGSAWAALPMSSVTTSMVEETTNGDLIAAGSGDYQILRWTGTIWDPLGSGLVQGALRTLLALPGNELLAGGSFTSAPDIYAAARWNGTAWLPLMPGGWVGTDPRVAARPDGSLVVAMKLSPISHLGLRSASGWIPIGSAAHVMTLGALPNGDVIAGGRFTHIAGVAANRIARWNGSSWSPLGAGVGTVETDYVAAVAVTPAGDVIAAGRFASAGGTAASSIARWNGTSWSALGTGFAFGAEVMALAVLPNGDVIAGGDLGNGTGPLAHIARWNGSVWQALGPGLNQPAVDLAVRHDGGIAACGMFTLPGPFGSQPQPGVALWSDASATWTGIGTVTGGSVHSLLTAANGDLVLGGSFVNYSNLPLPGIARWNGATWSGFGPVTTSAIDLALAPNGDIAVAGGAVQPGGIHSPGIARLSTTCPATVASIGTACTGAGAGPTLAATSLPWLGATFRSRATGLPANSLALEVLSHTALPAPVPLNAILPQGIAGCTLTTTPELLNLYVPNAGAVDLALPLAPSIAFVGYDLYQQVVALSFGPSFDLVALTSSNSLQLTKGWF